MTELANYLERLGLGQYLDIFIEEGFDTLETLLDIQEADFTALNVKLGHRRKLQRAIAEHRGIPFERIVAAAHESPADGSRATDVNQTSPAGSIRSFSTGGTEPKRKYRRHPKPDEHAPERPPSAYVIFSNRVREEVKDQTLSFTQIAKLVGERWQKLDAAGKEPYESQANAAKERYNAQFSTYKKTDAYKEYGQYLADFKAKHSGGSADQKRQRFDTTESAVNGARSPSARSAELPADSLSLGEYGHEGRVRGNSTASLASSIHLPGQLAPVNLEPSPMAAPVTASRSGSPLGLRPGPGPGRERDRERGFLRLGVLSSHSSPSDDSGTVRSDADPSVSLSLSTPTSASTPLLPPPPGLSFDQPGDGPRRLQTLPLHSTATTSTTPAATATTALLGSQYSGAIGPSGFGQLTLSPMTLDGLRGRGVFDARLQPKAAMQPPPSSHPLSSGSLSLPPLTVSDRADSQRMLPLPRSSPTIQHQGSSYSSGGGGLTESLNPKAYPFAAPTPPFENGRGRIQSMFGRSSEGDAADALAELATSGPPADYSRSSK